MPRNVLQCFIRECLCLAKYFKIVYSRKFMPTRKIRRWTSPVKTTIENGEKGALDMLKDFLDGDFQKLC